MPGKTNELMLAQMEAEFSGASSIFFGRVYGLKDSELHELRTTIRPIGKRCLVVKNQIARLALKRVGHDQAGRFIDSMTCVFTAADEPQIISKILVEFQKNHETFKVSGALIEGKVVDENFVKQLAALPSKREMRAQVVGAIKGPINGFVLSLRGLLQSLVFVLKAAGEKPASQT